MPTGTISLRRHGGLSAAALRYGNRIIEITSRGSIQVRGLTHDSAPDFAAAVAGLGIPAQDGVPVIADPLAGLDPKQVIDAGALAAELRAALAEQAFAQQLAPKISIAIDGGGRLHLDALAADIRLRAVATPDGPRLHVAAGGDAASANGARDHRPADAIETVTCRLLARDRGARPKPRVYDVIRTAPWTRPAPARSHRPDRTASPASPRRWRWVSDFPSDIRTQPC